MLTFFNPNRPALTPAEHQAETDQLRHIAQFMQLYGLCRYKRCYRDRVCLHDPRECVARYAPLASDGARTFMRAMLDTPMTEADFERMSDIHSEDHEDFAYWQALMENARTMRGIELKHLFEPREEDFLEEET